ncbi:MAG: cyclic-phosphate processing receiver domain-containing protein [Planctomycetaceae bacterium]
MYVAILEDDDRRRQRMEELLPKVLPGYAAVFFDDAPGMVAWLEKHLGEVALLCLDHDLGPDRREGEAVFDPGTGRDVVDAIATHPPCCPVLIHTTNSYAAPGMVAALESEGWRVERVVPFSDLEWLDAVWVDAIREQMRPDSL